MSNTEIQNLKERIQYCFDAFMPKEVTIDDRKQMAMYEAYHTIMNHLAALPGNSVEGDAVAITQSEISSLRYLLNMTNEKPKATLGSVLVKTFDADKTTNAAHLQNLWVKLSTAPPAAQDTEKEQGLWEDIAVAVRENDFNYIKSNYIISKREV